MWSIYAALFFTVALLVTTTYFILGGLPLLILDHSTPVDGRFVRRFFEVYCTAALVAAVGASIRYAFSGFFVFMLGTAGIALVVTGFKKTIIPGMQRFADRIQDDDAKAIRAFRLTHAAALLINLVQLVVLIWGVLKLPL